MGYVMHILPLYLQLRPFTWRLTMIHEFIHNKFLEELITYFPYILYGMQRKRRVQ
jgi:hypothetical protein